MISSQYRTVHYVIQVSPSCLEVAYYEVQLDSLFSSETALVKYAVEPGQQVLEITAPHIKGNELYSTVVGIKHLPNSHSIPLQLSM